MKTLGWYCGWGHQQQQGHAYCVKSQFVMPMVLKPCCYFHDTNWMVKMLTIGTFNINTVAFYGLMVPRRWCTDSKVDRWTAARNVHKQSLMEVECKNPKSNIFLNIEK